MDLVKSVQLPYRKITVHIESWDIIRPGPSRIQFDKLPTKLEVMEAFICVFSTRR